MRVESFEVAIPEGLESGEGYVHVASGQVFSVALHNYDPTHRCNATVTVNGRPAGTFRLDRGGLAQAVTRITHPSDSQQLFTAFAVESTAGQIVGAAPTAQEGGLIEVRFVPEDRRPYRPVPLVVSEASPTSTWPGVPKRMMPGAPPISYDSEGLMGAAGAAIDMGDIAFASPGPARRSTPAPESTLQAATVGLTGHTSHQYRSAPAMPLDEARAVTIRLRLVINPGLAPQGTSGQGVDRGNPIPPPIG